LHAETQAVEVEVAGVASDVCIDATYVTSLEISVEGGHAVRIGTLLATGFYEGIGAVTACD